MTIVELGRTQSISDRTSPLREFIRQIKIGPFTPDSDILDISADLDESDRPLVNITGVRDLLGAVYARKLSVSDMDDEQQSFFWDSSAQRLYLHLPPSDNPFTTVLLFGVSEGYCDGKLVYIDGLSYLPLVKSSPGIEQEQDIENYNKLSLITGSIELSNEDGRLDNLKDLPVYGNNVLMHYLPDNQRTYTKSDLVQLASLFVEDYDISLQSVSLRVQDRRKAQNVSIPQERFKAEDYPDIKDTTVGKVIPVLWGTAREIPAIITNDEAESGGVKYRAALLLTVLGDVYVEVESGVWDGPKTPDSISLATGEFELTATDGRDGTRALKAKLVAPTGIAITHITDIIKDASERFIGATYTESNYVTTEWEAEETAISTGAYYIDGEIKMFEMISDLQNGANVGFRYEITPNGRMTIRVDNEDRAVAMHIPNIVINNRDAMNIATNSETLAAEVIVNYNPSYVDDELMSRVVDDASRNDVIEIYQQQPSKTYDTILTVASDAQERAEYVRARFDRIRGIGEFTVVGSEYLTLRIYDIVTIEITPDEPINMGRPFYGLWRCKVLSIAPDPRTVTNTITAILIEEG